jgi:hypothetical protein
VGGASTVFALSGVPQYITIQDDLTTNITAWWSDDLGNLQKVVLYGPTSRTAILTPSRIGVIADNVGSNAASAYIFHFAGTGGFTP